MTKKGKGKTEFTVKQQRFIDFYDGNATEAARKAGYKGNENTLNQAGLQNLRKPKILEAIRRREDQRNKANIKNRVERQVFWSKVLSGEEKTHVVIGRGEDRAIVEVVASMSDRLKASELLGRSEADFTDNLKVEEIKPLILFDEDEE